MGKIISKVEAFGKTRFNTTHFEVDAIKVFYDRYGKDEQQLLSKIKHFAQYGKVWLKKSAFASVDESVMDNYAEEIEIGINQAGMIHANYTNFYSKLKGYLEASGLKCSIGSSVDIARDSVYIYNEYAGIPLMFIEGLDKYKECYIDQSMNNPDRTLHIDRNDDKFLDILTKTEEEVEAIIKVTKILIGCSILRIIDIETDDEQNEQYMYQDFSHFPPTPRPLGTRKIAIEILRKNKPLLDELEDKFGKVQKKLNIEQRKQFFNILTYHYIGNDFAENNIPPGPFPRTWVQVGDEIIEKFVPEHRAVNDMVELQVKTLKHKLEWDNKKLNEYFRESYFDLDKYSEKIEVKGKELRVFKKDILSDLVKKSA
jgi:hypothetical protein